MTRFDRKHVLIIEVDDFMGPHLVKRFRSEEETVIEDNCDLAEPGAISSIVEAAGRSTSSWPTLLLLLHVFRSLKLMIGPWRKCLKRGSIPCTALSGRRFHR